MPCFGSCLVCLGACLLGISSYAHYHSRWTSSRTADETSHPKCRYHAPPSLAARLALGCSLVASAGLAGVGAVDEIECWPLHATCAVCFFGGMCAWSVLDLASSTGKWVGVTRAAGVISAAVAIACKLAQLLHAIKHGDWGRGGGRGESLAYAEWLATVAIISYYLLANHAMPPAQRTHVAFIATS